MTKLVWDGAGARRYETGCDRGVLYLPDGSAVVWNGLTSVEEDTSSVAIEKYYLDGRAYLARRTPSEFSATIKALTYPDEFLEFDGTQAVDVGVFASNQPVNQSFGLSYRTMVGTDADPAVGYKIHILYNLSAEPDNQSYPTIGTRPSPSEFSWKISGIPIDVPGYKPTCHLIVDSTKVAPGAIKAFEDSLYGTSTTAPSLPDAQTVIAMQSTMITDPILDVIY